MSFGTSGREAATGAAARSAISGRVLAPESADMAAVPRGFPDRLLRELSPR
ncbi:hypothetical protein [Streptomyces yangpuensis]|uniref:hypothetical protein n=1 Tax=Streptomyces yangpuensis TaxID=1648182 RepID=UPI00371FB5C1